MSRHADKLLQVRRLIERGDNPRAKAAAMRLLPAAGAEPELHTLLALALMNLGEVPGAAFYAARAAELRPNDPRLLINAAQMLCLDGKHERALAMLDGAARLNPADPEPHRVAALALMETGRPAAARGRCEAGLAVAPGDRELRTTLSGALLSCGYAQGAVALLEDLTAEAPDDAFVANALALALNYAPGATPARVHAAHNAYGAILDRTQPGPPRCAPPDRTAGRRLRVGFVSPDFRRHSVAPFMLPLLRHLDRTRFEVVLYYTNRHADDMTGILRGLADQWRTADNISDEYLARAIAADRMDILIELSGHTQGHCLPALHRRPAPVQVTYLGYPNTTGVRGIDARVVDSITDPARSGGPPSTEQLLRLDPCFLCFEPPAAPETVPRAPGPLRFGSFNAIPKISDAVLATWAKIITAVPGSRLVLKAVNLREEELRRELADRFVAAGGPGERLDLMPPEPAQADHLAAYVGLDLALDPFPYNGTTTTLEALWMGVPVVTRLGDMHAGRVSASLLTALGLPELIARDEAAYIRTAVALATDPARLAVLRAGLRERLRTSPLCDGPGFSHRFETTLVGLWLTYAGGAAWDPSTPRSSTPAPS